MNFILHKTDVRITYFLYVIRLFYYNLIIVGGTNFLNLGFALSIRATAIHFLRM